MRGALRWQQPCADARGRVQRPGHGERSRLQFLLKLAGTENMLILAVYELAVNVLAVKFDCTTVSKSVLGTF